jgi:hypothetical protein
MDNPVNKWASCISERSPEKQTALYFERAVLVPTLSNSPLIGKRAIKGYMDGFLAKEGLICQPTEILAQRDSITGTDIFSGLYDFTYFENGNRKVVHARFTFVVRNDGLIVNHHSSLSPEE